MIDNFEKSAYRVKGKTPYQVVEKVLTEQWKNLLTEDMKKVLTEVLKKVLDFYTVLLLLLLRIVNGMFYPSASAEINRHISGNRAYLLSVQNLAQSASLAVGTPLLGYMIDNRGYSSAYISMLIFVLFIFIALIGWKYKNKH